jgi:hypothetical protein
MNDKERFLNKVKVGDSEECWEWQASKRSGYGAFKYSGRVMGAHVVSWELFNKEKVPVGMCVCHKCDNPPCVNPNHLFLGTKKDNAIDMVSKGRNFAPTKEICCNGHDLIDGNIRYNKKGNRIGCLTCQRDLNREYMRRKRSMGT